MMMPKTIKAPIPEITRIKVTLSMFQLLCFPFWPPTLRTAMKIALPSKRRHELTNQRDDGGPQNHHHKSRKDKEDQRWHHLHRSLCTHLFGALPAADAHVVRIHAQGLGDAGAEPFGLNQHGYQRLDVIQAGTASQLVQGLNARFSNAHFQVDELEFVAEFPVRDAQLLRNFHQRLIQTESSLNADHEKIQGIRQSAAKPALAAADLPSQPKVADQIACQKGKRNKHVWIGAI